jgi:hypothetical protein
MMEVPVIRLEVGRMKYAIMAALAQHAAQMDSDIQSAVEAYCTPENIAAVVRGAAAKEIDAAITEEVGRFFRYGDGRRAVAEAVKASLLARDGGDK